MDSTSSNMMLINDMFDVDYGDDIKQNQDEPYYIGKAENTLKQLNNIDNYFIFTKILLKNFNILNEQQKNDIIKLLNIKPIVSIIYKDPPKYTPNKNKKAKLNINDDY